MCTFQLYSDKHDQHRFRLNARNGRMVLHSKAYASQDLARMDITMVRTGACYAANFERKHGRSGWSFDLRANFGALVASSGWYRTAKALEAAIACVMDLAPVAAIREAPSKMVQVISLPMLSLHQRVSSRSRADKRS